MFQQAAHCGIRPRCLHTLVQTTFLDMGLGTGGGIAAGDVDDNCYNEVFVPWFSAGELHVFIFKP